MKTSTTATLSILLLALLFLPAAIQGKRPAFARPGAPAIQAPTRRRGGKAFVTDQQPPHDKTVAPPTIRGGAKETESSKGSFLDMIKEYLIDKLFTKEKIPWAICTALSCYYFTLYVTNPTQDSGHYREGFCVTGLDPATQLCSQKDGNSHQFAWGIDILYTIGALLIPLTGWAATKPTDCLGFGWFYFNAIVIAFVVVAHGILHQQFSVHACDLGSTAAKASLIKTVQSGLGGPEQAYALFIFILMLVDLAGFSSLPQLGWQAVGVVAAAVTGLIVLLSTGSSPSVSSFFMISQVAVSLTGWLFPNPETVTVQLGWSFVPPCIVSLLEYVKCNDGLVMYGGHSWYDFWLHLSMMVSLLFGVYNMPAKLRDCLENHFPPKE